jgi:hypothetical protein
VSKRYVAGSNLEDAVNVMKRLQSEGACFTIDVLGEDISSIQEAEFFLSEYVEVVKAISKNNLDANLSIKPTAFGLLIDKGFRNTVKDFATSAWDSIKDVGSNVVENNTFGDGVTGALSEISMGASDTILEKTVGYNKDNLSSEDLEDFETGKKVGAVGEIVVDVAVVVGSGGIALPVVLAKKGAKKVLKKGFKRRC